MTSWHLNIWTVKTLPQEPKKLAKWNENIVVDTTFLVYRSSHQVCSVRKGALRNFPKFAGKHLRPATLLKRRLWHSCFSVNFAKYLRKPFLQEHLWATASKYRQKAKDRISIYKKLLSWTLDLKIEKQISSVNK